MEKEVTPEEKIALAWWNSLPAMTKFTMVIMLSEKPNLILAIYEEVNKNKQLDIRETV